MAMVLYFPSRDLRELLGIAIVAGFAAGSSAQEDAKSIKKKAPSFRG